MTVLHRDQFTATVASNGPLCRDHYRLVLRLDAFPPTGPGQFVQVACRDMQVPYSQELEFEWNPGEPLPVAGRELLGPLAFLRRPFSLAGRRDLDVGGVELDLIHRRVGTGTDWMGQLAPGTTVSILGPLGNRFSLPENNGVAILVGGGVGIPPMIYLASTLVGRKAVAFSGALTQDLLPMGVTANAPRPGADAIDPLYNIDEFARFGVPAVISTDDGSYGFRGFITQALERYLDAYFTDNADRNRAVIYTCGPEAMMKRVAEIAIRRRIACQVAVERSMACGMGTCQSCVIRLKRDPARDGKAFEGKDWIYKLACTDGPVFDAEDLLW